MQVPPPACLVWLLGSAELNGNEAFLGVSFCVLKGKMFLSPHLANGLEQEGGSCQVLFMLPAQIGIKSRVAESSLGLCGRQDERSEKQSQCAKSPETAKLTEEEWGTGCLLCRLTA